MSNSLIEELNDAIVHAGLQRLQTLGEKSQALHAEIDLLLREIQSSCRHPFNEIVEGYNNSEWSDSPPFRVCKLCGYNEPGWNCGYLLLDPVVDSSHHHIPHVSWEEATKYVRGGRMTQEEKLRRMDLKRNRVALDDAISDVKREADRLDAVNSRIAGK